MTRHMHPLSAVLAALALAIVIGAAAGSSRAGATGGTLFITSNTALTADYHGQVVINADNVTLDCAGHAIIGPGTAGISALGRSNVTIRNCRVSSFAIGIDIEQSPETLVGPQNNRLVANTLTDNDTGVFILHATATTLSANEARANHGSGFELVFSNDHVADHNVASDNGLGFLESLSEGTLTANTAARNGEGYYLSHASGQATYNVATNNQGPGFFVGPRSSGSYSHNVSNNNLDGYIVSNTFGSTWTQNVANHNDSDGFLLTFDSSGNVLSRNVAHANGDVDAADGTAADTNTWTNNNFGTTTGNVATADADTRSAFSTTRAAAAG